MIDLRVISIDADYESWASITTRVIPDEPITGEQLRAIGEDGRLLLLAALDGVDAGCGVGVASGFAGLAFFGVRVLPEHRRRGVGTELVRALCDHARALGREGVNAFVDATDPGSFAFAEGLGLREVDYQLYQVRLVADEPPTQRIPGVDLVAIGSRRDELLRAAWPMAERAYADVPVPGGWTSTEETWLRNEATVADGSFVALELGEVVGYAGLSEHAEDGVAEHGLTAVARGHRGRGIARALKGAQLHWAAQTGLRRLVTWTQAGNEPMQTLNRSLGYEDVSKVLTMQGPLPL
jgi:RimJ/RimL family protein N-acetyltransferase